MILPTKGISPQRALVTLGADILGLLPQPKTVSRLWDDFRKTKPEGSVTFDWFVLSLDLLFLMGVVEFDSGRVRRSAVASLDQGESL